MSRYIHIIFIMMAISCFSCVSSDKKSNDKASVVIDYSIVIQGGKNNKGNMSVYSIEAFLKDKSMGSYSLVVDPRQVPENCRQILNARVSKRFLVGIKKTNATSNYFETLQFIKGAYNPDVQYIRELKNTKD